MPIVSHLGSKEPSLLGDSTLEKALVRQWVNFQVEKFRHEIRGSTGFRLSEFAQISEFFQF